jgi:Tol biopolymer transport system component
MCNPYKPIITTEGNSITRIHTETVSSIEHLDQEITTTLANNDVIKTNTPVTTPTIPSTLTPTSSVDFLTNLCSTTEMPLRSETNTIVFVANWDGDDEIYTINDDGTGLMRLTDNQVLDGEPVISPMGNKVGYESTDVVDGTTQIFAINLDGSEKVQLSSILYVAKNAGIAWSPDEKWVVFSAIDNENGLSDLYMVNSDGTSLHNFTEKGYPGLVGEPVWSPDGQYIAFTSYGPRFQYADIHIVSAETGEQLFAIKHPESPLVTTPQWNPQNPNQLLYLASNPGKQISQIGIINLMPLSQFLLTDDPSEKDNAVWSIDGKVIGYVEPSYEYSTTLGSETLVESTLRVIDQNKGERNILDSQNSIKYPSFFDNAYYLIVLIENTTDSVYDIYKLDLCDETLQLVVGGVSGKSRPRVVP